MPLYIVTKTGNVFQESRQLLKLRWVGPSSSNTCILQDNNSNSVWQETYVSGTRTPETDFSTDIEPVNGLQVAQIDGGTLWVYAR